MSDGFGVPASTRVTSKSIDKILEDAALERKLEKYKESGSIGPNRDVVAGMPPDLGLTPFLSGKSLLGILKKAKKSGNTVNLFRGVEKWVPGKMIDKGLVKPGGLHSTRMSKQGSGEYLYTTNTLDEAGQYGDRILEFEVPKNWLMVHALKNTLKPYGKALPDKYDMSHMLFKEGLPKQFLKKVSQMDDLSPFSKELRDKLARIRLEGMVQSIAKSKK